MHKFPPFCLIPFQPCCFLPLWTIHLFFPHPHLCPVPPPNSFFPNPLPPLFISFNFAFLSSWGRRYAFSLSLSLSLNLSHSLNVFLLSLTLVVSFSLSFCLFLPLCFQNTPRSFFYLKVCCYCFNLTPVTCIICFFLACIFVSLFSSLPEGEKDCQCESVCVRESDQGSSKLFQCSVTSASYLLLI